MNLLTIAEIQAARVTPFQITVISRAVVWPEQLWKPRRRRYWPSGTYVYLQRALHLSGENGEG